MTEVTKEMIEAGDKEYCRWMPAAELHTAIYLAMREKDPAFARLAELEETIADAEPNEPTGHYVCDGPVRFVPREGTHKRNMNGPPTTDRPRAPRSQAAKRLHLPASED